MKNIRTRVKNQIDRNFLITTLVLLVIGLITFISASLGVYTESHSKFWAMIIKHIGLGVIGGIFIMFVVSKVHYTVWKKYAPHFFVIGILITLAVFTPLGFSHGGARRWISLGFISFQPSEILKFTTILFVSFWFSQFLDKIKEWKYGFFAFLGIVGLAAGTLMLQPDSDSMALIVLVSFVIYWMRGAPWKHIGIMILVGIIGIGIYVASHTYIIERIKTFADMERDPYGSSYQIRQSRIAIGSGKLYGRGLGQSIQKFGSYLPESSSDSIFAIFAEEYGFVGSTILIFLYGLFGFFGFKIARHAPDAFSQNLAVGISFIIVTQVFLNIAAISGLFPLSGLPLIFMSNGGTALIVTLAQVGILLNISRYSKPKQRLVKQTK